jgi:TatD DNase family protein
MRDTLPPLIDIGVNLTATAFAEDRAAVIDRARAAGVARMVVTGTDAAANEQAVALCEAHPGVLWSTAGVHPHRAKDWSPAVESEVRALLDDPRVVAVGECGLDFFRDFSPRADQERAFAAQLALARATGKPAFLHQRDAHARVLAMLREQPPPAGVAHCFTGDRAELEAYLGLGLMIGITGWICDERRGGALREAARGLPLDRVLVETDAPYLLPRDLPREAARGTRGRNEPMHLPHVLRAAARCMEVDARELATASTRNAERLFGL